MGDWAVEPLSAAHEREEFSCGEQSLDRFLRTLVGQYERRRLGRTYVALRGGTQRVVGYYTLASGAVPFGKLPPRTARKLPRHRVPVVPLARLAVDVSERGHRLGRHLLGDALRRVLHLADGLGVHAVEVEALNDAARAFYEKHGFIGLADDPCHLYIPIATIERGLG